MKWEVIIAEKYTESKRLAQVDIYLDDEEVGCIEGITQEEFDNFKKRLENGMLNKIIITKETQTRINKIVDFIPKGKKSGNELVNFLLDVYEKELEKKFSSGGR